MSNKVKVNCPVSNFSLLKLSNRVKKDLDIDFNLFTYEENPLLHETVGMDKDSFHNHSFIAHDIWIGFYDNEECRIASFFHELGHMLENKRRRTKIGIEKEAWRLGFKVAKKYKIVFSKVVKQYMKECLKSYRESAKVIKAESKISKRERKSKYRSMMRNIKNIN